MSGDGCSVRFRWCVQIVWQPTCAGRRLVRRPARQRVLSVGPAAPGKSVTLKHVIGLLRPDRGVCSSKGRT